MKLKHKHRFLIFHIENKEKIVLTEEGDKDLTFEDFKNKLPENEPRYCVLDFHYETSDGRPQDKLLFVNWCPDTCGVKNKMLYASSKEALKNKLQGIAREVQANDMGDLDHSEVMRIASG